MIVQLKLNEAQVERLWMRAVMEGFKREDPGRRWTTSEKKEAIRAVLLRVSGADKLGEP